MIRYTRIVLFMLAVILIVGCGGKRTKVQTPATVGPRPEAAAVQSVPAAAPQAAQAPMSEHEKRMDELRQRYGVQTQPGTMPTQQTPATTEPAQVETSVLTPQASSEPKVVSEQTVGPLVTETRITNGGVRTVWDLIIPRRPDDRKTKLTYDRMVYGLGVIQQGDADVLKNFISEFEDVRPGSDAWERTEQLVIKYAGERVLTDAAPPTLSPEDIRIVTESDEIRQLYGNIKFSRMDWQRDPIGKCVIKKRSDLLNNAQAIEEQIDRVFKGNPEAATATKKAFRACAAQETDSKLCFDVPMKDIKHLLRNHGRSTSGENESYLVGTNRPDAHGTFYWVEGLGWKGNGWECCGNFLEPFTAIRFRARGGAVALKPPATKLACEISPRERVFTSREQVENFNLTVSPEQSPEDLFVSWFFSNEAKPFALNSTQVQLLATRLPQEDLNYPVRAEVVVGTQKVECTATVRFSRPAPPPAPKPEPQVVCQSIQSNVNLSEVKTKKDLKIGLSAIFAPPYMVVRDQVWWVNGTEIGRGAKVTLLSSHLPQDANGLPRPGSYTIVMRGTDQHGRPVECETSINILPKKPGPCGPGAWKCWVPPVAAGIVYGVTRGSGSPSKPAQTPAVNGSIPQNPLGR